MRYGTLAIVVAGAVLFGSLAYGAYHGTPKPPAASFSVKIDFPDGHGSGSHIGNGYIITAAHVVDGRDPKVVTDTGATHDAKVLWSNKDFDVALLRIADFGDIRSVTLSCAELLPGTNYVAYGNPGDIDFVHSAGEVVGKAEKRGPWSEVATVTGAIAQGMSGGGVLVSGRLTGVTVGVQAVALGGKYPNMSGFGYVVPGSAVCELLARD